MFFLVVLAFFCTPLAASERDGTVHVKSRYSVEETVERARRMIEYQGLRVFGIIDHQQEALRVKEKLLPTRLLVFGKPEAGTRIMRKNRIAGMDLPMKLLVWEAANGTVWITYHRADTLAERYGFSAEEPLFVQLGNLLKEVAKAVAN